MTPVPLDKLGLWGRWNHKSALWWLFLLYRRPREFAGKAQAPGRWRQVEVGVLLWWHTLPYLLLTCAVGRLIAFWILDVPAARIMDDAWSTVHFHAGHVVLGVAVGVLAGIALGLAGRINLWMAIVIAFVLAGGIVFGLGVAVALGLSATICFWLSVVIARWVGGIARMVPGGVAVGKTGGMPFGVIGGVGGAMVAGVASGIAPAPSGGAMMGVMFGIAVAVAANIARHLTLGFARANIALLIFAITFVVLLAFAFIMSVGIAFGAAVGLGAAVSMAVFLPRVYYLPVHAFLMWLPPRGTWYSLHPVAWDDLCWVPFPRLDVLLVAYAEFSPEAGHGEIERLIDEYPAQRMAALRARTILLARETARLSGLAALDGIAAKLPEGDKRFLKQTPQVRQSVGEVSALQVRLDAIDRPFLRRPYAEQLVTKIENFKHNIAGFREPLRTEFRHAADQWLKIANWQLAEVLKIVECEPTHQLFRAGDPVQRDREAFVARYGVVGELEQQITLATGCPGLVLYGRRRTGKSSIQANLTAFLPDRVGIATLSMQNPEVFTSVELLAGKVAEVVEGAVKTAGHQPARPGDLKELYGYLSRWNDRLAGNNKSLLIAVDEYEGIDAKIKEGVFSEDLLATLRESIQNHRHIIWMFAGTHEITELAHAPWTSYLVSVRTIEVPMFTPQETHLLLTEPMKHSTLWEKDDPGRPRFEPDFWGEGGIERIHREAGGWPHLVQLIAETCVDLVNEEGVARVDAGLFERALNKAIVRGHNVLYELLIRECTSDGELEYVSAFRRQETQPPPGDEAGYRSLRRRLLVEEDAGRWRLRVPLMARWLRERG